MNIKTSHYFALLALALPGLGSAGGDLRLNSREIIDLFSGNTSRCIKTRDNSTCATYMGTDGMVKRHMLETGKTRVGRWETQDDQLCITWEGKTSALCFEIRHGDDGTHVLIRKGKVKSTVTQVVAGDRSGF